MNILMFIMSLIIITNGIHYLFLKDCNPEQEIENMIKLINSYPNKYKKIPIITIGITLIIKASYFLYAAMMLQKITYILITTLIIVNMFDVFEKSLKLIKTYNYKIIKFKSDSVPQYIFILLEVVVACSVIIKIFQ